MSDTAEMLALLKRTHDWIDSLQIAGMSEGEVVSATLAALVERLLRAGGIEVTAVYLERHAALVRSHGNDMLIELRAR